MTKWRKEERWIVIGDVHGCLQELEDLLSLLQYGGTDRLLFLGDLVNRGPDSHGVMKLARKENAICLWGNHELRFMRARVSGKKSLLKTSDNEAYASLTKKDWRFMHTFFPYYLIPGGKYLCVHAGFLPSLPWRKQSLDIISNIQVLDKKGNMARRAEYPEGIPWADVWQGSEFVLYGHTPRGEVYRSPSAMCLDTACVTGGHLTAFVLPERKIVQVPAREVYYQKTVVS